jgi:hypothetical protein
VDRMRSVVLWSLAALAGILVAAGITLAASSLSSQQIGLSAEPLSAGDALVPERTATPDPTPTATPEKRRKKRRPQRTATPAPTATAVPTVEAGDDHGGDRGSGGGDDDGGGSGRGRGRGGDDD